MFKFIIFLVALQGADAEFARIEDWSKTQPDSGPGAMGIGDEYYKAAGKFPKDRSRFMDKANEFWLKAWPALDQFWKDKTRENLKKIYASHGFAGARTLPKTEWMTDGASITSERVHTGNFAVKLIMPKGNEGNFHQPLKTDLKIPIGTKEVEVSAWVLSDGTDKFDDAIKPTLSDIDGKVLAAPGGAIPIDVPIWKKVSLKIPAARAVRLLLIFEFKSRQGVVFIDDVSVKFDGKEALPNGGFER
jgi:hypothetical protein